MLDAESAKKTIDLTLRFLKNAKECVECCLDSIVVSARIKGTTIHGGITICKEERSSIAICKKFLKRIFLTAKSWQNSLSFVI